MDRGIAHEVTERRVRLDADSLLLDIPALAARSPAAMMLRYVKALELHTLDDRAVIELELAETDPARARAEAEAMARKLLANPVIESFSVEVA